MSSSEVDPLLGLAPSLRTILVLFAWVCFFVVTVALVVDANHTDTNYAGGDSGFTTHNLYTPLWWLTVFGTIGFFAMLLLLTLMRFQPEWPGLQLALLLLVLPCVVTWLVWIGHASYLINRAGKCSPLLNPASPINWQQKCWGEGGAVVSRYVPANPDPTLDLGVDTTFLLGYIFLWFCFAATVAAIVVAFVADGYKRWFSGWRRQMQMAEDGEEEQADISCRIMGAVYGQALHAHAQAHAAWHASTKAPQQAHRDLLNWHMSLSAPAHAHPRVKRRLGKQG